MQPNRRFWRQLRDFEAVLLEKGEVLREPEPHEQDEAAGWTDLLPTNEELTGRSSVTAVSATTASASSHQVYTSGDKGADEGGGACGAGAGDAIGGRSSGVGGGGSGSGAKARGVAFTTSGGNEENVADAV